MRPVVKSLLWDVDGTLAETERDGHLQAFNQAFEALGLPWRWSEARYGELLAVAGGRERLLHDMQARADVPADPRRRQALAERLHRCKNALYAGIIRTGKVALRAGVRELLEDCGRAGVRLGIVTTTSRSNVDALLETHLGIHWAARFSAVVSAEEAPRKKPDSQVYRLALASLRIDPLEAVAIEDAPAGVAAALGAGVPVIVTRSHYFPSAPASGALAVGPSLGQIDGWTPAAEPRAGRIDLEQIIRWHTQRLQ